MEHREETIDIDQLLFDPNNFRFRDMQDFVQSSEERVHEDAVQQKSYELLRGSESIRTLKKSILKNGYIPVERLVVRPHETANGMSYVVIEGNRRLACATWIVEEHESGLDVSDDVLKSVQTLPVIVVEEGAEDRVFRASLMGIRHVGGIKEWGGYQKALLIAEMQDDLEMEPSEVADRLGLTTHEVTRRYRALKALEQMREDDEFGDFADKDMYTIFHEAVSVRAVKDWLNWADGDSSFQNEENLQCFYELLSPHEDPKEDGEALPPKINTYTQVRKLREILGDEKAKRSLLNPEREFAHAYNIILQEKISREWKEDVEAAFSSLSQIQLSIVKEFSDSDIELLEKLREKVAGLVSDASKLRES